MKNAENDVTRMYRTKVIAIMIVVTITMIIMNFVASLFAQTVIAESGTTKANAKIDAEVWKTSIQQLANSVSDSANYSLDGLAKVVVSSAITTTTATTTTTTTTSEETTTTTVTEPEVIETEVVEVAAEEVYEEVYEETYVEDTVYEEVSYVEETPNSEAYYWDGPVLTASAGTVQGPSGKETYYNLNMSGVISLMNGLGYYYDYWVRDDGVKMFGDYVMVAANLSIRPKGTLVETSLGTGIVCDTGGFANSNMYQLDIATTW